MRDRSLWPFDAALFDLDGTLIGTEELIVLAWTALCAEHGANFASFDYGRIIGKPLPDAAHILLAHFGIDADPREWAERQEAMVSDRIPTMLRPMPGALRLVEFLHGLRVPIGVVTSASRAHATLALTTLGMIDKFRAIVTVDMRDLSAPKPDPAPYRMGANLLGAHPMRCIAFEDTAIGVTSARRAGCETYGVLHRHNSARDLHAAGAHHILDSLECFWFFPS